MLKSYMLNVGNLSRTIKASFDHLNNTFLQILAIYLNLALFSQQKKFFCSEWGHSATNLTYNLLTINYSWAQKYRPTLYFKHFSFVFLNYFDNRINFCKRFTSWFYQLLKVIKLTTQGKKPFEIFINIRYFDLCIYTNLTGSKSTQNSPIEKLAE